MRPLAPGRSSADEPGRSSVDAPGRRSRRCLTDEH